MSCFRVAITAWTEGSGNGSFKAQVPGTFCLEIYTTEYIRQIYLGYSLMLRIRIVFCSASVKA